MKSKLYILALILLLLPMSRSHASGVVINGADSVITDTLYYEGGLGKILPAQDERVIVEYAGAEVHRNLGVPPAQFTQLISRYPSESRLIIRNAGATVWIRPVYSGKVFGLITSANDKKPNKTPKAFALYQNYPNPFNSTTTIRFDLPKRSFVRITVFDVTGRRVRTLLQKALKAGDYSVPFDAKFLSSGLYIYRIEAGKYVQVRKLIVMK